MSGKAVAAVASDYVGTVGLPRTGVAVVAHECVWSWLIFHLCIQHTVAHRNVCNFAIFICHRTHEKHMLKI